MSSGSKPSRLSKLLRNRLSLGSQTKPKPVQSSQQDPTDKFEPHKASGQTNTAKSNVYKTLVITLRALEACLDVFPPVKVAVGGLIRCIEVFEVSKKNQREYEQILSEFIALAQTLHSHLSRTKPSRMPYSIANIARAIDEQVAIIMQQRDRWKGSTVVAVWEDEENIMLCYRRVEALFRQLQADVSMSIWTLAHEQWVDTRLKDLMPAHDAYYNSALPTEMQRQGCTENTREDVLGNLQDWAQKEDSTKIYWVNGMAGTGKTTIAYSLCERLERNRQLGASFFCSRISPTCRDVNRIISTLAYQLGRYSNPYQAVLCEVLGNEPDLARRNIGVQFEKLIVAPLTRTRKAIPKDVIVVIDALDECADANGMKRVLDLLFRHTAELPIKFFVTSRPEPSISTKLSLQNHASRTILHLHEVEQSLVQADIRTYLTEALAPIQPHAEQVGQLASRAGRLFIFAATVVRFISPDDTSVDHQERLAVMLETTPQTSSRDYAELDELYSMILSRALDGNVRENEENLRKLVLWTVVCARAPLETSTIAEILGLGGERKVASAIQPLHSVLHVSANTATISTLHASFHDFISSSERAGRFWCNEAHHHEHLATRCFDLMSTHLGFNICRLESSFQFDKNIPDIESRIQQAISPGLLYACYDWGYHLSSTKSNGCLSQLDRFLKHQLLFWMEVLSLNGQISNGEYILSEVLHWLPPEGKTGSLRQFIHDARNFVTTFATSPTSQSTPHLYLSVLPFISKRSNVWSTYWPKTRGLIRVEGTAMESRGRAAVATWNAGSQVNVIAQSTDGRQIISGFSDGTVSRWDVSKGSMIGKPILSDQGTIWAVALSPNDMRIAIGSRDCAIFICDAKTGSPTLEPLKGHTRPISSVAFSPDGSRLVSGSDDHSVRIWDVSTGASLGKFEWHSDCVMSVVFSPDGQRIASGSDDHTVRVWDCRTHTISEPFIGHTGWVLSVAFSPDGSRIASGSMDQYVRVWDSHSGKPAAGPFEGHTDRVTSVAFSPDGRRIVSGSFDYTIRVWESYTGQLLAGPFEGHHRVVNSVLFSIDGTRVLSGSADSTIRVWDARDSITSFPSSLHTGGIYSVVYSPDGKRAASGSGGHTICVWNTNNATLAAGPLQGHENEVTSVSFSPDGERIASCSSDCTLRTWDAQTGAPLAGPFKGHVDWVWSVAFSPDGNQLVSGSGDHKIRLWDSHTAKESGEPWKGHAQAVMSVVFSPNGARIVSGSFDRTVRMWDPSHPAAPVWVAHHTNGVHSVAFSPEGARIVSGSEDRTIVIWDAQSGVMLHGPFSGHGGGVYSVAFSPDGDRIVSGSQDRTVRLWDARTGTLTAGPFYGHTKSVTSAAFSPDGAHIISGSDDSTIRFWDLATEVDSRTSYFDQCAVNREGWVTDSESQLLLWVPSDLRTPLPRPSNSVVIFSQGAISADYTGLLIGDRWHECYQDRPSADS